jgi:TolB-like protein/Tfp pilus assembly protein PilF
MSVLGELKRRKMFQVAAVYLVVAWLIMQVIDVIHEPLRLPEWFPTVVIVLLAIGFPLTMIISWAFNVTPGGVVRDRGREESSKPSGRTMEFVLIGLVGVAVVWLIYRTEFDTQALPEPVAVDEAAPDVLPNSIAVLPFANLSPDPDNAFFAAGIHDTILNELAKIRDMNVVSRTAVLRYADGMTPLPQIAEELRVGTVMEGSVQYANGRVLVTAQLIDPQTNMHLWSNNYDRDFSDIFAIQADIATKIAEAMQANLSSVERAGIQERMTESPEAYALYLRAMEAMDWDFSPGDATAENLDLLNRAIELDPAFARAHAAKANAYSHHMPTQAYATESAETALSLDPNLGIAYAALAKVHARAMRDAEALNAFETALQLSPNDIDILDDFSRFLVLRGYEQRGLRLAERIVELDPGRTGFLALSHYRAGNYEQAREIFEHAVVAHPDDDLIRLRSALVEFMLGNMEAATREARIASNLWRGHDSRLGGLMSRAYLYGLLGFEDEASRFFDLFAAVASRQPEGFVDPEDWVWVYIGVGDWDKVLEYMKLTIAQAENGFRSGDALALANNRDRIPELDRPEFVELRKRLGNPTPDL